MKTYRLTSTGRRTTLILMIATVLIGGFALYTLQSTLGFRYLDFGPSVAAMLERGLGPGELIPGGILLMMIIAAPLLLWSLWEEWSTTYGVSAEGLTYKTVRGIALHYPWSAVRTVRRRDEGEAIVEVVVAPGSAHIPHPLLRWLHHQAFGANIVPIYPGVEARDELIGQIVERAGLNNAISASETTLAEPVTTTQPARKIQL